MLCSYCTRKRGKPCGPAFATGACTNHEPRERLSCTKLPFVHDARLGFLALKPTCVKECLAAVRRHAKSLGRM